MVEIKWDLLSDADLVTIAKTAAAKINSRIESKKMEAMNWASKFKNKEEMVLSYMGEKTFKADELTRDLLAFFKGENKSRIEQIKQVMSSLLKKSKVVKNGDSYTANR